MQTKPILVAEMIGMASDRFPDQWQSMWRSMKGSEGDDDSDVVSLETWLDESYFDGERPVDFTKDEVVAFCKILRKLLFFEPSSRAPASAILEDPWFSR
jgi:hypothetical protein